MDRQEHDLRSFGPEKTPDQPASERRARAQKIQDQLTTVRQFLKRLAEPQSWDRAVGSPGIAFLDLERAGRGTGELLDPVKGAKEALRNLDEARAQLPRFFVEEEREPVTLKAAMAGKGGAAAGARRR